MVWTDDYRVFTGKTGLENAPGVASPGRPGDNILHQEDVPDARQSSEEIVGQRVQRIAEPAPGQKSGDEAQPLAQDSIPRCLNPALDGCSPRTSLSLNCLATRIRRASAPETDLMAHRVVSPVHGCACLYLSQIR